MNTKNERITTQRINGMHIIPKPLLVWKYSLL